MDATMILCDAAEEVNGKLYILGGGWSVMQADQPSNMAIAIKLSVPWDQTNRKHVVAVDMHDADGTPVETPLGRPQASLEFELGRPPGLKPGTPLDAPFVVSFPGVALEAGTYVWVLEVDGDELTRTPFTVVGN
jgi:hypothetical protein